MCNKVKQNEMENMKKYIMDNTPEISKEELEDLSFNDLNELKHLTEVLLYIKENDVDNDELCCLLNTDPDIIATPGKVEHIDYNTKIIKE